MFHSPQDKDDFYAGLQRVIDQVSEQDILVVMGDWNARVGSSQEGQLGPPCLKTNPSSTLLLGAWRTGLALQKHGLAPGSTLIVTLYPSSVPNAGLNTSVLLSNTLTRDLLRDDGTVFA